MAKLEIQNSAKSRTSRHTSSLALGAKLRPVGSYNLERDYKSNRFNERFIRKNEQRGHELLMSVNCLTIETVKDYWDRAQPDGKGFADLSGLNPVLAVYDGVTDMLRFVKITGVELALQPFKGGIWRVIVATPEGDASLPQSTKVLWRSLGEQDETDDNKQETSGI